MKHLHSQVAQASIPAVLATLSFAIDSTVTTLTGSQTLTNKTLTTPIIAEIDSGAAITLDATTDIVLDADGGDITLKDGGTTFGNLNNSSGELVIQRTGSTPTTAITMSGADVTIAGDLTISGDDLTMGTTPLVISWWQTAQTLILLLYQVT